MNTKKRNKLVTPLRAYFFNRIVSILFLLFPHLFVPLPAGSLQDMEQLAPFRTLCKSTVRVTRVRDIQEELTEAICLASSGTPGPVLVELPVDILYPYQIGGSRWAFLPFTLTG